MNLLSKSLITKRLKRNVKYIVLFTVLLAISYATMIAPGEVYAELELSEISKVASTFKWSVLPLLFLFSLIIGNMFGYLHSSSKSAWINSMPYTRTQVYVNYFVVGVITLAIPFLINGVLYSVISIAMPNATPFTAGYILMESASLAFVCIVLFSVSSVVSILCSSTLVYIVLTLGIMVLPATVVMLVGAMFEYIVYGFAVTGMTEYFEVVSPVSIVMIYDVSSEAVQWIYYLLYGVVGIGSFLLGRYFINKRKMESVHDWVGFKEVESFIQVAGTFCVSVFASVVIGNMIRDYSAQGLIIRTLVIGLVVYVVITMFFKKSFKILKEFKMFGVFVGIVALIFVGGIVDITGYSKKIPSIDEVSEVTISSNIWDSLYGYWIYESPDQEDIELAVSLHEKIVENSSSWVKREKVDYYTRISYTLEDGSEINRYYSLSEEGNKGIVHEVNDSTIDFSELDVSDFEDVHFSIPQHSSSSYSDEVRLKVLEAYIQDRQEMSVEELMSNQYRIGSVSVGNSYELDGEYHHEHNYWYIGEKFENTLDVLKEEKIYNYENSKDRIVYATANGPVNSWWNSKEIIIDEEDVMKVYEKSIWNYLDNESMYVVFKDQYGIEVVSGYVKVSDLEDMGIKIK